MRRLSSLALAALVACASAPAPTPAPTTAPAHRPLADGYDVVQAAPGVFVFLAHPSNSPIVTGNSIAIVGDDGVLVVDTGQFPALARRMIADLRRLTDQPVRYVVNTHWHNDHVFGNAVYRDAFPGVQIVAHAETLRLLQKNGPKQAETYRTKVAPFVDHLRASLASGKNDDGSPMTDFDRAYVREEIADGAPAVALWKDVELAPPTSTFEDERTILLGKREVKLLHFGRGNTAGDAMVYVPDAKLVATGDVVVAPTPFATGAYITEWGAVLEKTEALGATTIVPGHGPIMRDTRYLDDLRALLAAVDGQTRAAAAAGATVENVHQKVDLSRFRARFAKGDPYLGRAFDRYFAEPAVERVFQEVKGKLEDE